MHALQSASKETAEPSRPRREQPSGPEQKGFAGGSGLTQRVLTLQRQLGNRYVQRMVALAREAPSSGGPSGGPSGGEITPEVEQSIARARGGGRSLDSDVRGRMEASFGTGFGGVRVHTGGEADRLNRQLSARAFATGSDIFFRDGEYRPGSSGGRELIAHELTHVVQQQGSVQTSRLTLGPPGDRFEQEADSVARQVMRDEEVSVAPGVSGGGGVARSIQREDEEDLENDPYAEKMNPVIVPAGTFDQAATNFANALRERYPLHAGAGVIVINGANIRVYDGYGQPVASMAFRLKRPSGLGPGVYAQFPDSALRLRKMYQLPDGTKWDASPATVTGSDIDFRRDVEPRAPFDNALKQFKGTAFYLVPGVVPSAAEDELPKEPVEKQPEFMKFDTHEKAELKAYPSAVVPLTPQVAPVGTTGKFYCKLDKISWFGSTVNNVFTLLERVNFKWEVLKLDPKLLVTKNETATRWDATKQRFRTKERHIRADEETMRRGGGSASFPEKVYREYLTAQMAQPRRILGYTGEAVLTLMNSLVGGKDPNVEDYIDFTFKEPGDYFVRCLATPIVGAGQKRATSVAGVMVSVHKLEDVAAVAVQTPEKILEGAAKKLERFDEQLAKLRQEREDADSPEKKAKADFQIGLFEPRRAFLEAVQRAGGDTHSVLAAELDLARAQLAFLTGKDAPVFRYTPNQIELRQTIEKLKQDEKRLAGQLERSDSKLGDLVKRTGFMHAILLDDVTGAQQEVLLSIGERQYVATDRLEVVIADVTSSKGRRFTGTGTGSNARSDAWTEAMRDLQRHLGRGRGWLSYQAPPPYGSMMQGLANPLQLQVAELDQIKDVVDDAMNALTLAALIAVPFTGGASLGVLAVLMPIQLGSSLYNIVNRAMYDDLELDADAVFSLLDIASFGVAKIGTMGKVAKRSVGMMSASGRIALALLDGGGYVLISYTTYMEIMEDRPGETPQEARLRKLQALLGLFQAAAIPIADKLYSKAGLNPPAREADSPAPEAVPAKPAPRPEGAPAVPQVYLDVLKGVARKVPPVVNPDLPKDTVRIQYRKDGSGVITEMWMEIGPGTRPELVRQHVPTARDMARFMGLSGRVRKVYQQVVDWLSKNPKAGPGSRAWEARLELAKLQRILDERFTAYDKAVAEGNTALRDELSRELDHLEAQLLAHARDVDSFETGGRGFVAAKGTRGTFSPETSRSEAFRELGGYEARVEGGRRQAASDLGRFVEAAVSEKVATGPEDFVRQMPDPRGLSPEAVLRQTKEPYLAKLAERVTDAKRLHSLASYHAARKAGDSPAEALHRASHAEGTRVMDLLPETDRAAFAEAWAARSAAISVPPGRRGEIPAETLTGMPAPPPPRLEAPGSGETGKRPNFRDVIVDGSDRPRLLESEWILAKNTAGADVFKSLTPITSKPFHMEGIVAYAQETGQKVTLITGFHGLPNGYTTPEKRFAIDDDKYYGKKYPDVKVIDTSDMTHKQRMELIDSTPGVVILATCYGASLDPSATAHPSGPYGPDRRPRIRDVVPMEPSNSPPPPATNAPSLEPGMVSEWTPTTNAVGAEVFKSTTPVTYLPPHVEGLVVYGRRKGKVTIITGYYGSPSGDTLPEKQFAVDDAKYYRQNYPDVAVIDTSGMTHDQRLAVIEATPGVVIVSTCYAACARPSGHGAAHMESIAHPDPEMFKRLSQGINTRPPQP